MKVYVVGLKTSIARRESINRQFKKFNFTNYVHVDAVYGKDLSDDYVKSIYDDVTANRVFRSLSRGEIGCALTHNMIYQQIIDDPSNERCLIIEDDVIIDDRFADVMDIKYDDQSIDILFFGCHTSNNNADEQQVNKNHPYELLSLKEVHRDVVTRCYFKHESIEAFGIQFNKIDSKSYRIDYLHGTHAYSPSKVACKRLLEANMPVRVPPDMPWCLADYNVYGLLDDIMKINHDFASDMTPERKEIEKLVTYSKYFDNRINLYEFGR